MQVTTKIKLPEGELTNYLTEQEVRYGEIYRTTYRMMISDDFEERFKGANDLRKWLSHEFEITGRLANTIVREIAGRLKALREHKKHLLQILEREIYQLDQKIAKLERSVARLKDKARNNTATDKELARLRINKEKLYHLKNKREKKKVKRDNIRFHLKEGRPFRIGFGSRKRFKKQFFLKENGYKSHQDWYEDYRFYRDHNIASSGAVAETGGNQLSTLFYKDENGTFSLRFRKFDSKLKGKDRYLSVENLKIGYLKDEVRSVLTGKTPKPLYHRFVRTPKGYYLHVSFELDCPKIRQAGYAGSCGLDFNNKFVELAVSDLKGNLTYQAHIELPFHGCGERAKTELNQKISGIVKFCKEKNLELVVEDLDFVATKAAMAKGTTKQERRFNRIVHTLDYRRYKESLERACKKEGLKLTFINPYNTTKEGFKKYGQSKKLNRHQAAAYFISRHKFERA